MANANLQLGNLLGIADATAAANSQSAAVGDMNTELTATDDFTTRNDLRTALQAIDGTTYSDAELNHMTYNDMVYALRLKNEKATFGITPSVNAMA